MSLINATYFQDLQDTQIAHYPDFDARVQEEARRLFNDYDPAQYEWSATPTTDLCRVCYEWRRFPPGQRHFGYAWWRVCPHDCPCDHHAGEVWIAS
jgi:hypothetical protein